MELYWESRTIIWHAAFNPKSPPSQRIILRIEGFSLQGSEGSGNFGHPVPVEDSELVANLLSRLRMSSSNGVLGQASSLGPLSQAQSQASVSTDDTSSSGNSTPAAFSTQAPTKAPYGKIVGGHDSDTAAAKQALLVLLNRSKGPQTTTRNPLSARISELPYAQKPCDTQVNGGSGSASSSSSASRQHSSMPSAPTMPPTELRVRSKKNQGHLQGNVLLSQETPGLDDLRSQQVGKAVNGVIKDGLLSQEISTTGGIETIIRVREDGDKSLGCSSIISKPHRKLDTISRPVQDTDNPWEGLTRIPRRYVQIPKDQRDILERDDAWYTQVFDDRQPGIKLPSKICQEIQTFHDTLGSRVGKGESDSDGASDNESSDDNHSGSNDEHSERQNSEFVNNSRGVKKAMRRSIGSKSLPSSRLVPPDRAKDMTDVDVASSESVSSDQDDSSVECSLDLAEMDSENDTHVGNTERSSIQIDRTLPNGKVLPDTRFDVSSASLNHEDGDSADEGMSWSSIMVKARSSQHHFLQDESQGFAKADRIYAPKSVHSQESLPKFVPIALMNARTPSTEEDDADSERDSLSILQNRPEYQPTRTAGRTIQALKAGLGGPSGIFSSSPVEMELSVPYGLEYQTRRPDDVFMTDMSNGARPMPATREQSHSSFDIERTLYIDSSRRSPRGISDKAKSDENSKLKQQRVNISSDPIIPGTLRSEASDTFNPRERASTSRRTGLKGDIFGADQVISATPGPPTRLQSPASAPADKEKLLTQVRKHAESEIPTHKNHDVRGSKITSPSVDNGSKTPVGRQHSWTTNDIEISTSPTVYDPLRSSITGSQVAPSESLPPSPHAPIGGEAILSARATPIKRRASGIRDMTEPSLKRRRTLQAVIFDSAPEKDSTIDPTEMAKANRRKFLQELSLTSSIQSQHKLQEDNAAQINRAADPSDEMLLENTLGRDSIRVWRSDFTPSSPPHGDTEIHFVHPENSSPEESQDSLLYHTGHNVDIRDKDPRKGKIVNEGIRSESTGLSQSKDIPPINKMRRGDWRISQTRNIFEKFNKMYPNYGKSLGSFVRACVCLDWLHSTGTAPHPSLWDDFIRAFSAEYLSHIQECKSLKQKPMSALEFYNSHVTEPVFMGRIMTLARLQEAFLLDPEETAKGRAKTQRQKYQNSQESISTASSQITITGTILAKRQDTPSTFHEAFTSTQQLPNADKGTSRRPLNHAGNVETVSSHLFGVVSAPHTVATMKRPFFETPSQLVIEARRIEIPTLGGSVAAKEARNDVIREDPPVLIKSPDIEIVRANVIMQTPRRLPWSSPSQGKLDSGELVEVTGVVPGRSSARGQDRSLRQPDLISSLTEREGSPILGSLTSNSYSIESQVVKSEISPALSSNLGSCQGPIFKAPGLPESKSLGRRTASMPGPGENGLDEWRASHGFDGSHSLRKAKAPNSIIPKITATFKDFSKTFVPRQKRRSNLFSRVSTPSLDASPSRIVASNTLRSKLIAEPDTQAWRF